MSTKPTMTFIILAILGFFGVTTSAPLIASGHSTQQHTVSEQKEKGAHNGHVLKAQDFTLEVVIFNTGISPEMRVYASYSGKPVNPQKLEIKMQLSRIDGAVELIHFSPEGDYLRSNTAINEPHSFTVTVDVKYQDKHYHWSYDNVEGRTHIDEELAQTMGIKTEPVTSQTMQEQLKVYGKLTLPAHATRNIKARFAGQIKRLYVQLGEQVKKGQALMQIEANSSLQAYTINAPIDGVITLQNANEGEQTGEQILLTISNSNQLLAELQVFPLDQAQVKLGASVDIRSPHLEHPIRTLLSSNVYNLTETQAKVYRAVVDNSQGQLSAGQFVTGHIVLNSYTVPLAVKVDALQMFHDANVVYGKFGDHYEVRVLELGRRAGQWVEVLGGIKAGTQYVTTNSYLIKADIEKSGASHAH